MFKVRLHDGASAMDARIPPGPVKLPRWISAVVLVMAAAAIAIGLILAGFGLFAALRIAHGYAGSVDRVSVTTPFVFNGWQRTPTGGADHLVPTPIAPTVLASSDAGDNELSPAIPSARDAPPARSAEPAGIAEHSNASPTRLPAEQPDSSSPEIPGPAPGARASDAASRGEVTTGIDRAVTAAPARESVALPPQQTKRPHAAKQHVVRKRVRHTARRPASSGAAANPFQPMFSSPFAAPVRRHGSAVTGAF